MVVRVHIIQIKSRVISLMLSMIKLGIRLYS